MLTNNIYIYIYIYIERERERERECIKSTYSNNINNVRKKEKFHLLLLILTEN